jgi:hypothetical protein
MDVSRGDEIANVITARDRYARVSLLTHDLRAPVIVLH